MIAAKGSERRSGAERTVEACNFRSAGKLSNESARVLTTLFEMFARNLMNSLDVYLGASLEIKLASLHQFTMEEYRAQLADSVYVLPCSLEPSGSSLLLDLPNSLVFTMVDLLLGGNGALSEGVRELTEIDEEVMQGVAELMAEQVERVWEPIGVTIRAGRCIKPTLVHKLFSPLEKVLVADCEFTVAGVSGVIRIGFPASVGGHLVRNIKADPAGGRTRGRYMPRLSLSERILAAKFTVEGNLPATRVPVRQLAALAVGEVFLLPVPVETAGQLTLEDRAIFSALPVRSGTAKAVQLVGALSTTSEGEKA